jgi:hypothetical protein
MTCAGFGVLHAAAAAESGTFRRLNAPKLRVLLLLVLPCNIRLPPAPPLTPASPDVGIKDKTKCLLLCAKTLIEHKGHRTTALG